MLYTIKSHIYFRCLITVFLGSQNRDALYRRYSMRMFSLIAALFAALFLLAACSQDPPPAPMVKEKVVNVPTLTAEQQVMKANAEIVAVAKKTARSAGLKDSSGCNIIPEELADLKSFVDSPLTGKATYGRACRDEVFAMRSANKQIELAAIQKANNARHAIKQPAKKLSKS